MKLRIRGDSIRLRLTRGEVETMGSEGRVEESTHFPDGSVLVYRLEAAELEYPQARFDGGCLSVRLPRLTVSDWVESDMVSIRAEQALDSGRLSLLVEKDFQCLAPREGEDESDMFPNPDANGC